MCNKFRHWRPLFSKDKSKKKLRYTLSEKEEVCKQLGVAASYRGNQRVVWIGVTLIICLDRIEHAPLYQDFVILLTASRTTCYVQLFAKVYRAFGVGFSGRQYKAETSSCIHTIIA
jgi:hypothetical protein